MINNTTKDDEYGVLLYYNYTNIPNLTDLSTFYTTNCTSLSLLGRIRLSPHGVNATIGGQLSSLKQHITQLTQKYPSFTSTDFKLSTSTNPKSNNKIAQETGFTSLSIRIVKQLVTFTSRALPNPPELSISNAGQHLSAREFHSVLETARDSGKQNLVLLDARNLYETRIGKFSSPNFETLDPKIRQYSDLSNWVDDNSEKIRGKQILMYCTGGIRCEVASAYIKSKGEGFENVFQLYGGIQRYMEEFPEGGFFKGKNFVFDHRVSVASSDPRILGSCLVCEIPFDDYSSRSRCNYCRMLVLVCHACEGKNGKLFVCELCQKYDKLVEHGKNSNVIIAPRKKLRILCLHGFRQNASSFKGRTASFVKKLKNIAEFVYIDAPHQLRFIYQEKKNADVAFAQPKSGCNRKYAWLIDPNDDMDKSGDMGTDWETGGAHRFDCRQYEHQTGGFDESYVYLREKVVEEGPFDGVLGFSQGAAMAACVALKGEMGFRFVILCSGYFGNFGEFGEGGLIKCPSLHIYGSDNGKDRQIGFDESRRLALMFEEGCSVMVEHDFGHIIPTKSPYIDTIKDFLQRFL
ncbi:rhodanese-like domain-containing protein 6 [Lactuca sativa]|uniref:Rhodanese domain-containing protein n=1 Tax=Lactuca sativa TaxID=4236 RepID=A0A9R1UYQ4_LACSA|nr:rhodanese-like domain-containing protein 6 [Lactuca sativa]XP_023759822.1 rhodanese-like domain-containing protein 6 [Lactuca sativa]XP_023759823.1 rhodanese-like domain-containing protein 6 [Lactuca sativa]XP_023759824.1 rhodanese-like domain-containing protein 6 [Lactuca sativa]XP_023759825.1 rhodanese-like domain-containing protein 6 [Lactuca sativa]KAJ0195218.1 hypothetical protein LSAT_V11C700373230 [Lactuca sativa]